MVEPYPPSFGDSQLLFTWALGSITGIACVMASVCGWMARDIWRDRNYVPLSNPVMIFRLILMIAGFTGFFRAMPEAIYMYAWNEVTPEQFAVILRFKRLADGMALFPAIFWPTLLTLAYPAICLGLKSGQHYSLGTVLTPWSRLVRPAFALVLVFSIAFLVAISKMNMGVPAP